MVIFSTFWAQFVKRQRPVYIVTPGLGWGTCVTITDTVHGSRKAVQGAVKGVWSIKKNDFQRSTNIKLFSPTEGNLL